MSHFRRLKMSHPGGTSLGRRGLLAAAAAAGGGAVGRMEQLLEVSVLAHPVAVAPNVDDVAVVDEAIDQRAGHDVVPEDLPPLFEALAARKDGGGALVAAAHELEEEHRPGVADWQVPDLVHNEERGEDDGLEPLAQPASGPGFLERRDQVGERAVIDPAPTLGGRTRQIAGLNAASWAVPEQGGQDMPLIRTSSAPYYPGVGDRPRIPSPRRHRNSA